MLICWPIVLEFRFGNYQSNGLLWTFMQIYLRRLSRRRYTDNGKESIYGYLVSDLKLYFYPYTVSTQQGWNMLQFYVNLHDFKPTTIIRRFFTFCISNRGFFIRHFNETSVHANLFYHAQKWKIIQLDHSLVGAKYLCCKIPEFFRVSFETARGSKW